MEKGQNDDLRVLKRVGAGLGLVALGIFQMHTHHVNGVGVRLLCNDRSADCVPEGDDESSLLHTFHTDEAHRALSGHHGVQVRSLGVTKEIVLSTNHTHHEVNMAASALLNHSGGRWTHGSISMGVEVWCITAQSSFSRSAME